MGGIAGNWSVPQSNHSPLVDTQGRSLVVGLAAMGLGVAVTVMALVAAKSDSAMEAAPTTQPRRKSPRAASPRLS